MPAWLRTGLLVCVTAWAGTIPGSERSTGPETRGHERRYRGWFVELIAEAGNRRDERNYLGQAPAAHNGIDFFDAPKGPPGARNFVSLAFTNPELPRRKWGYQRDIRASAIKPTGEWSFTVRASRDVGYVTVTWKGDPGVLNSAWLIDLESGAFIRAVPGGQYSYLSGGGSRRFTFAIYQR